MTPLVVAHRGFHRHAVENTLEAFSQAIGLGVDMIELDVQETADGQLVVFHDDEIEGIAIRSITASRLRRKLGSGHAPPFAAALELAGGLPLDVEIKNATAASVLEAVGVRAADVVTSFDPGCLRAARSAGASRPLGLILEESVLGERTAGSTPAQQVLGLAAAARADFVALDASLADTDTLATIHHQLARSYVWNVDDRDRLESLLADPHVAAVITDRPDLALSLRRPGP